MTVLFRPFGPIGLCLVVAACQTIPLPPTGPDLRRELITKTSDTPPRTPKGACWAADTIPAVIETRTEQIQIVPERRNAEDVVTKAAVFRTVTQQRIVQERRTVWFGAPCPADLTVEFIATLQRALKARGYYLAAVTGQIDMVTRHAIRRYQEPLGLDSDQISVGAARSLGIIAADFGTRTGG